MYRPLERNGKVHTIFGHDKLISCVEDRQLFLNSVLSELRGSELQVATDPDCAIILARLLPSLGDWGRRVVGDAFGDGWEQIFRHRFGSHVAQTWLCLAADTLDREVSACIQGVRCSADLLIDEGQISVPASCPGFQL